MCRCFYFDTLVLISIGLLPGSKILPLERDELFSKNTGNQICLVSKTLKTQIKFLQYKQGISGSLQ
jgi:hypothetical protein